MRIYEDYNIIFLASKSKFLVQKLTFEFEVGAKIVRAIFSLKVLLITFNLVYLFNEVQRQRRYDFLKNYSKKRQN